MTTRIPTRSMPECWECGYKSLFEEHFVLGDDDVFRCNVCDDEKEKDDGEPTR